MNVDSLRNDFRRNLAGLIDETRRILDTGERDPFAGDDREPHEHDTRLIFLDRLLEILGWRLGVHGNVHEESRIKDETTRFMDYVGIVEETKVPLLIIEAKAWDKPRVKRSRGTGRDAEVDLLVEGIRHVLSGKSASSSPLVNVWHEYLEQVCGYVRSLYSVHGHETPRVVISSGAWMVIFTSPVTTFVDGKVSVSDIVEMDIDSYTSNFTTIFELLHRSVLANDVPFPVRPTQLSSYVGPNDIDSVFFGLHLSRNEVGSRIHGTKPRIVAFPAVLIQRCDGVLVAVCERDPELSLEYSRHGAGDSDAVPSLDGYLDLANEAAHRLLADCETELGTSLVLSPLDRFVGFRSSATRSSTDKKYVKVISGHSDEWLLATGATSNCFVRTPRLEGCSFHSWKSAFDRNCAVGQAAIMVRSVTPRSMFIDGELHHCANQVIVDRRVGRCHIDQIDERTCCQACSYRDECWSSAELARLPCCK